VVQVYRTAIDFIWDKKEFNWNKKLQLLQDFYKKYKPEASENQSDETEEVDSDITKKK